MTFRVAYYFAAFAAILMHNLIFPVKGQPTVGLQHCENGDSSISFVAEMKQLRNEILGELNKQVQGIHELLNASFQEMKNHQDSVMISLQAVDRRSQEQDIYIKQVQSIHELLNSSFQQMKNQHTTAMRRLDVVTQLLLYHDISVKNQTQNFWKFTIGIPLQLESGIDLEDGFVLLPSVDNWIVLMNRFDDSLNFSRNWSEYRNGFGEIGRGEFWLGNEIVHRLTNTVGTVYTLRIELYANGRWFYAEYATFSLDSEDNKYALHLSGFNGNAGDSLTNKALLSDGYHGGMSFSTWDADNDRCSTSNCVHGFNGGWWFNCCDYACLTCLYDKRFRWYTLSDQLQAARMMIKSR